MDVDDLYRYIKRLERDGYDSTPYWLEFFNRFSLALTPVIVTLLGGSIVLWREDSNILLCLSLGIGFVFIFWLLHSFGNSLGAAGLLPPLVAAWGAELIFTIAGLTALRQVSR